MAVVDPKEITLHEKDQLQNKAIINHLKTDKRKIFAFMSIAIVGLSILLAFFLHSQSVRSPGARAVEAVFAENGLYANITFRGSYTSNGIEQTFQVYYLTDKQKPDIDLFFKDNPDLSSLFSDIFIQYQEKQYLHTFAIENRRAHHIMEDINIKKMIQPESDVNMNVPDGYSSSRTMWMENGKIYYGEAKTEASSSNIGTNDLEKLEKESLNPRNFQECIDDIDLPAIHLLGQSLMDANEIDSNDLTAFICPSGSQRVQITWSEQPLLMCIDFNTNTNRFPVHNVIGDKFRASFEYITETSKVNEIRNKMSQYYVNGSLDSCPEMNLNAVGGLTAELMKSSMSKRRLGETVDPVVMQLKQKKLQRIVNYWDPSFSNARKLQTSQTVNVGNIMFFPYTDASMGGSSSQTDNTYPCPDNVGEYFTGDDPIISLYGSRRLDAETGTQKIWGIKYPCVYVHGSGAYTSEFDTLQTNHTAYWGDIIHQQVDEPCFCSVKYFVHLNTLDFTPYDTNLAFKLKNLLKEAEAEFYYPDGSSSKDDDILTNMVIFTHGTGKVMLKTAMLDHGLELGHNANWVSLHPITEDGTQWGDAQRATCQDNEYQNSNNKTIVEYLPHSIIQLSFIWKLGRYASFPIISGNTEVNGVKTGYNYVVPASLGYDYGLWKNLTYLTPSLSEYLICGPGPNKAKTTPPHCIGSLFEGGVASTNVLTPTERKRRQDIKNVEKNGKKVVPTFGSCSKSHKGVFSSDRAANELSAKHSGFIGDHDGMSPLEQCEMDSNEWGSEAGCKFVENRAAHTDQRNGDSWYDITRQPIKVQNSIAMNTLVPPVCRIIDDFSGDLFGEYNDTMVLKSLYYHDRYCFRIINNSGFLRPCSYGNSERFRFLANGFILVNENNKCLTMVDNNVSFWPCDDSKNNQKFEKTTFGSLRLIADRDRCLVVESTRGYLYGDSCSKRSSRMRFYVTPSFDLIKIGDKCLTLNLNTNEFKFSRCSGSKEQQFTFHTNGALSSLTEDIFSSNWCLVPTNLTSVTGKRCHASYKHKWYWVGSEIRLAYLNQIRCLKMDSQQIFPILVDCDANITDKFVRVGLGDPKFDVLFISSLLPEYCVGDFSTDVNNEITARGCFDQPQPGTRFQLKHLQIVHERSRKCLQYKSTPIFAPCNDTDSRQFWLVSSKDMIESLYEPGLCFKQFAGKLNEKTTTMLTKMEPCDESMPEFIFKMYNKFTEIDGQPDIMMNRFYGNDLCVSKGIPTMIPCSQKDQLALISFSSTNELKSDDLCLEFESNYVASAEKNITMVVPKNCTGSIDQKFTIVRSTGKIVWLKDQSFCISCDKFRLTLDQRGCQEYAVRYFYFK